MPRPRKNPSTLPPCYYLSHGVVYHVKKGVWRRVGTEADAHREYADRISAPEKGGLAVLIDAVFDRMKTRKVKPLAPSTIVQYGEASNKLKEMLELYSRPDQVNQKVVANIKVMMGRAPGMANRVLSFGSMVFSEFLEHQMIDSNPFVGVKRYPASRRERLIVQSEWDKIYKAAKPRMQCIMDLLYLTDQRIDDVLAIDERHLLEQGVYFKQKKRKKEIIVAWNDQLRAAVARAKALHKKVVKVDFTDKKRALPLFKSAKGGRPAYKTIYSEWVETVKLAGIEDCNLHDNRAFSATDANEQGIDPQKLLGHVDAATTRIYLRGRKIEIVQGPQMKRSA